MFDQLNLSENTIYYIAMILIYSGLGSWLIAQLTRSQADERRETRSEIKEALELADRLAAARDRVADPVRRAAFDAMLKRLNDESAGKILDLNALAAQEDARPSRRFIIIPTPRSFYAVLLTLIFAASCYFAVMFLLTIGFDFWTRPEFDVLNDPAAQTRTAFLAGSALGLLVLAAIVRWLAFRAYNRHVERMRREAAEAAQGAAAA